METIIPQISFAFDILITLLLGATIYFAIKLSRHLDSFRSNRTSMEGLIRELSNQITRAQEGISVLDELSANRGDELRTSISKAHSISDELQMMTQSGNSLADRLETMVVRNRAIVDEMDDKAKNIVYPSSRATAPPPLAAIKPTYYEETLPKAKSDKSSDSFFNIRDPDFEDEDKGYSQNDTSFSSQAERDLDEALKNRLPKGK